MRPVPNLRKAAALAAFDNSPTRLAEALGIRPQAVSQWGEFVPRASRAELFLLRPELRAEAEAAAAALEAGGGGGELHAASVGERS